jgi:predicted homoserine dehydrogenase-like protein
MPLRPTPLFITSQSRAEGALLIGLAHDVSLECDITAGAIVRWSDVAVPDTEAVGGALRDAAPSNPRTAMGAQ